MKVRIHHYHQFKGFPSKYWEFETTLGHKGQLNYQPISEIVKAILDFFIGVTEIVEGANWIFTKTIWRKEMKLKVLDISTETIGRYRAVTEFTDDVVAEFYNKQDADDFVEMKNAQIPATTSKQPYAVLNSGGQIMNKSGATSELDQSKELAFSTGEFYAKGAPGRLYRIVKLVGEVITPLSPVRTEFE